MPIDREKALGADLGETTGSYGPDDVILYHLGIGAGFRATDPAELAYTFEKNLKVLPSFAVVASSGHDRARARPQAVRRHGRARNVPGLSYNPRAAAARRAGHRDPPPAADRGGAHHARADRGDLRQGQGGARIVEYAASDRDGPLFTNRMSLFLRGEGGFGGPSGPPPGNERPARAPDGTVDSPTLPQQALLYRLNGDKNPLHADPEFAKRGGFDRPILHGLCSFGIVCKAIVDAALGGDPTRVARYAVRFAGVAFPGETLRTSWWRENGKLLIDVQSAERGAPIITNAAVHARA